MLCQISQIVVSVLKIRLTKCRYVGQLLLKLAEIQQIADPLAKCYLIDDTPAQISLKPFYSCLSSNTLVFSDNVHCLKYNLF